MSQVLTADVCPNAPRSTPPTSETALFEAAKALLPVLAAGRLLDANVLREAMTRAFGASDAEGAWVWKDAYEAAEVAVVLFLKRYGRAMRRRAGAGPEGPAAMLAMLQKLSSLEPSHTKRSEEQVRLQQFSTPLGLAYAALRAAAVRPGDVVMEPSAGTGMLAVMAECALGGNGALHLNEIANTRAGLLARLFPEASVTRHNAEAIADHLPGVRPDVVLMNPPFSATPGVSRVRHDADLRHIRSAFFALAPGGRLVAVTSAGCVPGDAAWNTVFSPIEAPARVVFTLAIEGRAYARRGTSFDTRLTVIERSDAPDIDLDPQSRAMDAAELLDAVMARVPPRMEPETAADLFGNATAPRPARPKRKRKADERPTSKPAYDWGPVSELAYETAPPCGDAAATGPYVPWKPGVVSVPGAVAHPTPLVQSAAMAAVAHPAPDGTQLADERANLLWGFVNTLDAQTQRLDRAADRLIPGIRELQREQDGSEIRSRELELTTDRAQSLSDRRDAFEQLRDTAAEAYRVETGEVWRPRRGSHVSQTGKLTSAMIDARDFQRARKDRENTAHLPQGTLVAVAGGKEAGDIAAIIGHLDRLKAKYADIVLVHGGGPGAEKIAAGWAERNGVHQVVCKPDWDAHGRAAPFRRNDELLALLPKGVIAFPGSGITDNLVDKARSLGIPVQRVAA